MTIGMMKNALYTPTIILMAIAAGIVQVEIILVSHLFIQLV